MDTLPFIEVDIGIAERYVLLRGALQMHLDTSELVVVQSNMAERRQIKPGARLAIQAGEQIKIECGGHTLNIVVGATQDVVCVKKPPSAVRKKNTMDLSS